MEDLLAKLKAYDWGGDRGALMGIDESIVAAHGKAETLAEIEQALLEVLQSDAPIPAKEYICRQLALIGTDRCVPMLAALLLDAELSDRARLALEAIPTTAAEDALRTALDKVEGDRRAGIVNSLDERKKRLITGMEHHDATKTN